MKNMRDTYPLKCKVRKNVEMASGETVKRGTEFKYAKYVNNGEPRVLARNGELGAYFFRLNQVVISIA